MWDALCSHGKKKTIFCENPLISPQIKLKMMFSGYYPHSLRNWDILAKIDLYAHKEGVYTNIIGIERIRERRSEGDKFQTRRFRRSRPAKSLIYHQHCNFCYVYLRNVMLQYIEHI